jgi:Uma2 family endonuclease
MAIDVRQPALHMTWNEDRLVLSLAPLQGRWTEEQYLLLTDQTNQLIEFTDGYVEVLPMPTDQHQVIVRFLFLALYQFLLPLGGEVLFAPLRVRVRADKFREPDILLVRDPHDPRRQNRYWLGADLVVEVVSPDNPERDMVDKRADYAEAGIGENWIVNPEAQTVTVLTLVGDAYTEHGVFGRDETATSALLSGFAVSIEAALNAR